MTEQLCVLVEWELHEATRGKSTWADTHTHTHTPPRQPGGGVSRPSGRTGVTLLALMPNCNGRCLPQRRWSEGPSPSISLQHPMNLYLFQNKELFKALTGVAQWVGRHPINQKVSDSILIRPHAWVAGQVLGWGCARGK